MAKIIAICGPDRVGKATQSKALCDYIKFVSGKRVALVTVPIHDVLTYKLIYWMLQSGLAKKLPKTFQTVQHLNRCIFQVLHLPRLERDNDYVVFDRWSLSSIIYGPATGVDSDFCENLYRKLRKPDFTIVLLGKSHSHDAEDVYEADSSLQARVRALYAEWSVANPHKSKVVDCTQTKQRVTLDIVKTLVSVGILSK